MELRQILREASRRAAAELDSGKREAVSGRPDRVARKLLIWTPELDLRVLEVEPDDWLGLVSLSCELDVSVDRLLRRRRVILNSTNQEMMA